MASNAYSISSAKKYRLLPGALCLGMTVYAVCLYLTGKNLRFTETIAFDNNNSNNEAPYETAPLPIDPSFRLGRDTIQHAIAAAAISNIPKTKLGLGRDPADSLPPHRAVKVLPNKRLLVIPEYKLLFCYIEKVGCSMFNQLFRLLRLYHPSQTPEERQFLAESHFGRANPEHFNMTARNLTKFMNDDQWTKAVFFRDPADRFLSGFKSKCGGADADGGRHCRQTFGETTNAKGAKRPLLDGGVASFNQTIDFSVNATRQVFRNPHFKPAAKFCGGLANTIDHYQVVHLLDKKTVGGHVKTLFDHLGVDEKLTEGLLERVVKTGGMLHPFDFNFVQETYGLRMRGNISASHNTAKAKLRTKDFFQSPEILQKLQNVYKADYDMFHLEPPRFEDILAQ
jgi:hypothetical protein